MNKMTEKITTKLDYNDLSCWGENELIEKILEQQDEIEEQQDEIKRLKKDKKIKD